MPKKLTCKKNFVLFKIEEQDGRLTKIPYNVYNGKKSKANTPETWAPFQLAVDTYRKGGYDGIGYVLTGNVKEEKALFLTGGGRNGKGTFTKSLLQALGNKDDGFAVPFKIDSILQSTYTKDGDAASPEFAKLQHKRCAISEEIPKGRKLNEALFKQLTGGDPLSVRRLRCDPFVIIPQFKMILSGNYLPELDDAHDIGLRENY